MSFPLGIGAATYLKEFAPRNRLSDFIEINFNNLAAVSPSIREAALGIWRILTGPQTQFADLVSGLCGLSTLQF